jgi:hypothetical protein
MDAVVASLVSGFGGAIVGALVGGGASWLTVRHQARLDAEVRSQQSQLDAEIRRMDRLDQAAVEVATAAMRVVNDPTAPGAAAHLQDSVILAMGRANVPCPTLAKRLSSLLMEMSVGRSPDAFRTGAISISTEITSWLGDPVRYEAMHRGIGDDHNGG